MNRYQQPRISAIGALAAALATVATIGAAVLLPATLAPTDASVVAAQRVQTDVAVIPSIEVIGYRTEHSHTGATVLETREARESAGAPKS